MGKINEYGSITTPATDDLLFIGDTSNSYQISNITVQNLHTVPAVRAAGAAGLGLTNNAGSYGLFVKNSNAFVGVGTATPSRLLHLYNNTGTVIDQSQLRITNAGAGDAYIYLDAGTDWSLGVDNSDGDRFKFAPSNDVSDGAEILTLQTDGNVGVGSSSPGDLFEVSGDASSTVPICSRINFNTASGAGNSYGCVKFAEDNTPKAYITYMGSNFTTAARRNTLEFRASATGSAGGITFFADNSGNADVFLRGDGKVGIGPNAWSLPSALPQAALHVKGAGVDDTSDAPLLQIEATTNNAVVYFKNSGGAAAGYIINSYNSIFIGSSSVPVQDTHLQISKTTGSVIIGGPLSDYTYPLTVGTIPSGGGTGTGVKPTLARFIGYNSTSTGTINGKSFLVLTSAVTNPQLGIVYQAEAPDGKVEWLSGTFYVAGPTSYFGWRYLGGSAVTNPDNASFYSSPLESNTVYMGTDGGISSANTAAAFGSVNGNGAGNPVLLTGAYNVVDSPVAITVSGAVATITFTKDLSNATYTVIATGWDVTNTAVMFGEVTAQAVGSCAITFRTLTTTADLETSGVKWTFAIYGAKLKA